MKTELLRFRKYSNAGQLTAIRRSAAILSAAFFLALGTHHAAGQTSVTVPDLTASSGFTGVYASSARTYQLIIDDSLLTALNGKYLTSIAFRLPANATSNWPATDATFPSYEIFLSNGVEPPNRQFDFSANVVGPQTQVRSGVLVVPAGALTSGADPNAFSHTINFNTPYLYTGTNLVIEIRHTGNDISSSRSTNSTGTSTAGYGTLYTACWQGTAGVVQGNFSFVKINSQDALGVKSVELDTEMTVYPNPVKDVLHVRSARNIIEFTVFNYAGQKILVQSDDSGLQKLNVAPLPAGNYILQTLDKEGNAVSARFIKD